MCHRVKIEVIDESFEQLNYVQNCVIDVSGGDQGKNAKAKVFLASFQFFRFKRKLKGKVPTC